MKAFGLRNQYRTLTRAYMKDTNLAAYLNEVEKNQQWEVLLGRTLKKEGVDGDYNKVYKKIIESSQTGRDYVDDLFHIH